MRVSELELKLFLFCFLGKKENMVIFSTARILTCPRIVQQSTLPQVMSTGGEPVSLRHHIRSYSFIAVWFFVGF